MQPVVISITEPPFYEIITHVYQAIRGYQLNRKTHINRTSWVAGLIEKNAKTMEIFQAI